MCWIILESLCVKGLECTYLAILTSRQLVDSQLSICVIDVKIFEFLLTCEITITHSKESPFIGPILNVMTHM